MKRKHSRNPSQMREINFTTNINSHAEGSCIAEFGQTKLHCTASFESKVPRFLRDAKQGWLTAEYSMLPRSTHTRIDREVNRGKLSGRTQEIQRLIGRSLRSCLDLTLLRDSQIIIDCDVLQADGGTRTTAINGGFLALSLAINNLLEKNIIPENPIKTQIAAISCGLKNGEAIIDLDYEEDSNIDADANFIFNSKGDIVEIQVSAEQATFTRDQFNNLYDLAENACQEIFKLQQKAIAASE